MARHGGPHNDAKGKPDGIWNPFKFGGRDLLVVFAIDDQGGFQAYYRQATGKPPDFEEIPSPLADLDIEVKIGNPKVCWKTTGGDQECVVY